MMGGDQEGEREGEEHKGREREREGGSREEIIVQAGHGRLDFYLASSRSAARVQLSAKL